MRFFNTQPQRAQSENSAENAKKKLRTYTEGHREVTELHRVKKRQKTKVKP